MAMQSIGSINMNAAMLNIAQTRAAAETMAAGGTAAGGGAGAADATSFKNILLDSIQEVNSMQRDAADAVEGLATGEDVNPAEVLTAVQKADIAFRLMMQIRNKLVDAYNQIENIHV